MKQHLEEPIDSTTQLRWVRKMLTSEEIAEILLTADKVGYKKSTVVTNDGFKEHPDRTSESCWLAKSQTPLIRRIEDVVCELTGCQYQDIEPIQVVKYENTQKYNPHFDYFDCETGQKEIEDRGQRVITILVYLKAPTMGGETHFPRLNIMINPSVGDAVMWHNCTKLDNGDFGNVIPQTEHAGMPVKQGTKVAMNIWIRNHTKSQ